MGKVIVAVKHENSKRTFLFIEPEKAYTEKGDEVLCDTKIGQTLGVVTAREFVNDNVYKLICDALGVQDLNNIVAKINRFEI